MCVSSWIFLHGLLICIFQYGVSSHTLYNIHVLGLFSYNCILYSTFTPWLSPNSLPPSYRPIQTAPLTLPNRNRIVCTYYNNAVPLLTTTNRDVCVPPYKHCATVADCVSGIVLTGGVTWGAPADRGCWFAEGLTGLLSPPPPPVSYLYI